MLDTHTIINATDKDTSALTDASVQAEITDALTLHGYCILRDFPVDTALFSKLVRHMCRSVTFDPARQSSINTIQKVDAGTDAIGLHIENGNTPNVPEIVAFYCRKAARKGSRTTLCDGAALWRAMNNSLQASINQPVTVTRTLPEHLWKAYLVNEHPLLTDITQVTAEHLSQMLQSIPRQHGVLHDDGSLTYSVEFDPIRISKPGMRPAFANAILGPSFGYEKPVYRLPDRSQIEQSVKSEIESLAESLTIEIPWHNGDIAIIDNWRVMHGRRRIMDTAHREMFIGMGNL